MAYLWAKFEVIQLCLEARLCSIVVECDHLEFIRELHCSNVHLSPSGHFFRDVKILLQFCQK